ncbi:MAG: hypothetical protein KGL39_17170 [Patescibacteria group bacterium]|nr:hypothetical protein [Patescibacteria group bacterium]
MADPGVLDVLAYQVLSAAYDSQDMPTDFWFTDRFYKNPKPVDSDNYRILFYNKMRRPSPLNKPGAKAKPLTTGKATEKEATLFSAFNVIDLPAIIFTALQEPDSYALQDMGKTELQRILAEGALRDKYLIEATIGSIMNFGAVSVNAGGDVVYPTVNATTGALTIASGAQLLCDMGVSNNNRGNLNGLITQLWSDPNAKIGDQLDAIRNQSEAQGTKPPTKIKAHTLARRWLRANYQFQDWAVRNNVAQDSIMKGDMYPNLWGFDWEFFGGKFETNNTDDSTANSTQDLIPTTQVIIHPDDGPWIEAAAGLTLVPTKIGLAKDLNELLANMAKMYGPYAYAAMEHNPPKLQLYSGNMFGVNFADPRPIYMPTVFAS